MINNNKIKIKSITGYFEELLNNNIFLNIKERKEYFKKIINNFVNFELENENLNNFIDNIAFVEETPLFLFGEITFEYSELFLAIITKYFKDRYLFVLKDKILFFYFIDKNGKNDLKDVNMEELYKDNFKVLKNNEERISKYIYKFSHKINSQNDIVSKKNFPFFNSSKAERINNFSKFISIWIPFADITNIQNIFLNTIFEYNFSVNRELDLSIKSYIVSNVFSGKESELEIGLDAIRNLNNKNDFPKNPTAIAIYIASLVDEIVSLRIGEEVGYLIDKKYESILYYNLINIIIKYNLNIPIDLVLNQFLKKFIKINIKNKKP